MSGGEILIILVIYLLFFGAKGIPSLAQTLGKALYQFRNATRDVQNEIMQSANEVRKQASVRMDQMDVSEPTLSSEGQTHFPPPVQPAESSGQSAASSPQSPASDSKIEDKE
ncbi:MAG: twin-arginine translocase TatA/TatE family subunit [Flavobacteriales bacterium]